MSSSSDIIVIGLRVVVEGLVVVVAVIVSVVALVVVMTFMQCKSQNI
jgi:hypothetical protein